MVLSEIFFRRNAMKTCLIDVGGGLRGVYGAGVMDKCMDLGIVFDGCIGVSAGAGNLTSYLSGQRGRGYRFYFQYSFRPEYMSMGNFIRKGSYFDLDYVYGTLPRSDGENPLDYAAMKAHPACGSFYIVASEAESGKARYFTGNDLQLDDFEPIKASCAIPGLSRPIEIDGIRYFDGAISDPVPIRKAVELGYDKIVLILTRPLNKLRDGSKDKLMANMIRKNFPMAAHNLTLRAKRYNDSVAYAKQLAAEGRVLILAPDDIAGIDTTKHSKASVMRMYGKGFRDANAIADFLK